MFARAIGSPPSHLFAHTSREESELQAVFAAIESRPGRGSEMIKSRKRRKPEARRGVERLLKTRKTCRDEKESPGFGDADQTAVIGLLAFRGSRVCEG